LSSGEFSREVIIKNETGLHVRPAATIVDCAKKFNSDISLSKDGHTADAKSALSLMTLAAEGGSRLMVRAVGPDSEKAVEAIVELFENQFNVTE
jgi:phosphocarrier protein